MSAKRRVGAEQVGHVDSDHRAHLAQEIAEILASKLRCLIDEVLIPKLSAQMDTAGLPPLLTRPQAAQLMGKSPKTLESYKRHGIGPLPIGEGKDTRYSRDEVLDFMKRGGLQAERARQSSSAEAHSVRAAGHRRGGS
jgi:hypothetical protein